MFSDVTVDTVLLIGYVPDTDNPHIAPCGGMDEQAMAVRGDGETEERQTFIVAISPEAEIIVVQEECSRSRCSASPR